MKETGASMNVEELPDMTTSISPVAAACTAPALIIREGAFNKWLTAAKAGDRAEYHRGALAIDRAPRISSLAEPHRKELVRIADRAMALAEDGRVLLLQERRGTDDFSYMAVMAKRKRTHRMTTNGAMGRAVAGAGA